MIKFSSKENEFALVLRVFYQWYNDRASEPASYKQLVSRDRNDTTANYPEAIDIHCNTIFENKSKTAGVYELEMTYPHLKEKSYIPVCVIDGKIYLDFVIKTDDPEAASLPKESALDSSAIGSISDGFFRAASGASGITISVPVFAKEVVSFYKHGKDIYKIRYWLSEMEFSSDKASFSDGNQVFSVSKYLKIGNRIFQCTTGRSTKIRNIEKSSSFEKNIIVDGDGSIIAFGKEYLVKVPELDGGETLLKNVAEKNSAKKPAPKPLFPPSEINFHWKEISELEKYNPYTWNRRNLDVHK